VIGDCHRRCPGRAYDAGARENYRLRRPSAAPRRAVRLCHGSVRPFQSTCRGCRHCPCNCRRLAAVVHVEGESAKSAVFLAYLPSTLVRPIWSRRTTSPVLLKTCAPSHLLLATFFSCPSLPAVLSSHIDHRSARRLSTGFLVLALWSSTTLTLPLALAAPPTAFASLHPDSLCLASPRLAPTRIPHPDAALPPAPLLVWHSTACRRQRSSAARCRSASPIATRRALDDAARSHSYPHPRSPCRQRRSPLGEKARHTFASTLALTTSSPTTPPVPAPPAPTRPVL
jgi:hypothetical protein